LGEGTVALMLVLLDSNIYFSALISPRNLPSRIIHAWRSGRFTLLTCQQQIDEIREASRNPKFRDLFQPHQIGKMLNHLSIVQPFGGNRCRTSMKPPILPTAFCSI